MSNATVRAQIAAAFKTVGLKGIGSYEITYTPKATGTPSTFDAAVATDSNDIQNFDDGEATVDLISVTISTDDVAAPVKYDTVTFNSQAYGVENILYLPMFASHRCTCKRIDITENWAKSPKVSR